MSSEPEPAGAGMNAFAADLAALRPAPGPIDRDRILFAAGRASARAERRPIWPAVAASLALVAAGEAALLLRGPSTHTVERVIVIREPARPEPPAIASDEPAPAEPSTSSRLAPAPASTRRDRLADQILRYGLEGLPASPPLATWSAPPGSDPGEPLRSRIDPSRFLTEPGDPS